MLSYDLVEDGQIGDHQIYRVWIDGVSPKSASLTNKNKQPLSVGKYVGRIVHIGTTVNPGNWVAIPSFVDHGDPYGDIELDLADLNIYLNFKTSKKAINQLRKLFTMRLAEIAEEQASKTTIVLETTS